VAEEQADDAQALNETLTAGSGLAHAPRPSTSAFRGGVEFANVNKNTWLQYFREADGLGMHGLALSTAGLCESPWQSCAGAMKF